MQRVVPFSVLQILSWLQETSELLQPSCQYEKNQTQSELVPKDKRGRQKKGTCILDDDIVSVDQPILPSALFLTQDNILPYCVCQFKLESFVLYADDLLASELYYLHVDSSILEKKNITHFSDSEKLQDWNKHSDSSSVNSENPEIWDKSILICNTGIVNQKIPRGKRSRNPNKMGKPNSLWLPRLV